MNDYSMIISADSELSGRILTDIIYDGIRTHNLDCADEEKISSYTIKINFNEELKK